MRNALVSILLGALLVSNSSCFGHEGAAVNPLTAQLQGKTCQILEEPGVTHSKADSELGAIACLGFLHGRDRAWQMDFLRRIVEGRRAEILGYHSLKDDLQMKLLGLDQKAKRLFDQMTQEQKAPLWAYAYGVNQGFETDRAKNAYEFKTYHYQPDAWEPVNSIEVLLLQSFDQTRDTFTKKLDEAGWLSVFGPQAPALFAHQGLPWSITILKEGEYPRAQMAASLTKPLLETLPLPQQNGFPIGEIFKGSNNWAIAPQRSLTKNAFFANDPHLDLKHPPFWYWAHIEGGKLDAMGASLPGTPNIASGTNRNVAWGLTNAYFDVSELAYIPNDDLKNGNSRTFYPLVWVRFGSFKLPFFFKGFQKTVQGWPVLPIDGVPKGYSLVLRWSGYEITPADLNGAFEIMKAENAREADLAFSHLGLPTWNFTFADTHGVIGYRTVGRLPKREQPLPYGVPKRRLSEWAPWTYLSADEAPHVLQPARGYVATANNQQWPSDSLYRDGRVQAASFRAFRIEELIKETPLHNRESLQKIQCDQQAIDARFIIPSLLKELKVAAASHGGLTPRDEKVFDVLKSWDFNADESCRACGVWMRWMDVLLGEEDLTRESLYRFLNTPQFQSNEAVLTAVLRSFHRALDDLGVGADGALKTWGEIHRNPFTHFSGDPRFAVPPIPTGGVANSVNPGTADWDAKNHQYLQSSGASQRMIVEMSTPPSVHVILAGSNQDIKKPNLSDPQGPWMKWKRCELEQLHFPIDWRQVQTDPITLH